MISKAPRARRLVGRAKECAFFDERAKAAMRGHGSVAMLLGGPGAGKTRLLHAWRAIVEAHGFAVASAENYAFARTPYAPIVEALTTLVSREPRALSTSAPERALLERFLSSSLPESLGSEPQPWEKRRLFAGIARTLTRIAAIGPVAIFLDDVHWIDAESLEVVQYVASTCVEQRTIIVLAARADAHERSAAFDEAFAALDRIESVYRVNLSPLAAENVRELVLETAPASQPLSRRTVTSICRLSEGNPLLVEDLVREALERPNVDELLPKSVEQSVQRRMQALGKAGSAFLEVAAASGAAFDSSVIAEIAEMEQSEVDVMLERAHDADLISADGSRPGWFRFRHELTRVAAYGCGLPLTRRRIHRKIAVALEAEHALSANDAALAWHWERAGDLARAAHYAQRAGEAQFSQLAYASAGEQFELALSDPSLTEERRCSLEERLGQVALNRGDVEAATTFFGSALARARRLEDRTLILRTLSGLRHARARMDDLKAALALADDAIALVLPDEPEAFECFSAAAQIATFDFLNSVRKGEGQAERERVAGYLARARFVARAGDVASELRLLNCEGKMAVFNDDIEAARQKGLACATVGRGAENPFHREMGLEYSMWIAREIADFSMMKPMIHELIAVADECDASYVAASSRAICAHTSYLLGDVEEARELMYAACAQGIAWSRMRMHSAVCGIPIAVAAGDGLLLERVAAPDLLEELLAGGQVVDIQQVFLAAHLDLAAVRGESEMLRNLVEFALEQLPAIVNHHAILVPLARYVDDEQLERVATFLPRDDASGFLAIYRSIARAAIAKRRGNAGARAFTDIALSHARRARSPVFEALAHEVSGNLADAIDLYRAIGATGDVRRLEPRGASAKRTLSRREHEIAELVGRGLSNRDIGHRLSISDRTVEHHITSIFIKLGLRSRAELMAYVIRATSPEEEAVRESLR